MTSETHVMKGAFITSGIQAQYGQSQFEYKQKRLDFYSTTRATVSIEIPCYRSHFIKFSKAVFYEVNLVSQCSHLEVLLPSKLRSERGDFN